MTFSDPNTQSNQADEATERRTAAARTRKQEADNIALAQRFAAGLIAGFVPGYGVIPDCVTPVTRDYIDRFMVAEKIIDVDCHYDVRVTRRARTLDRLERGGKSNRLPYHARFWIKTITRGEIYHLLSQARASDDKARESQEKIQKRAKNIQIDLARQTTPEVMQLYEASDPLLAAQRATQVAFAQATVSVLDSVVTAFDKMNATQDHIRLTFHQVKQLGALSPPPVSEIDNP